MHITFRVTCAYRSEKAFVFSRLAVVSVRTGNRGNGAMHISLGNLPQERVSSSSALCDMDLPVCFGKPEPQTAVEPLHPAMAPMPEDGATCATQFFHRNRAACGSFRSPA